MPLLSAMSTVYRPTNQNKHIGEVNVAGAPWEECADLAIEARRLDVPDETATRFSQTRSRHYVVWVPPITNRDS